MKTSIQSLLACLALATSSLAVAADKTIGITYFIEHPIVSELLAGFKDGLKAEGIVENNGYKFQVQSAQGSPVTATQIAKKFAGDPLDVILSLSTPSTQAMVSAVKDIPIVFGGVTDPLATKLVSNMEHPGGNVTGSKDAPPIDKVLALIRDVVPNVKTVGVVYNAGEANSKAQIEQFKALAKSVQIEVFEATVTKPSDVQSAAQALVGRAQAIFLPNDGTVTSNFEVLNRVQLESKIPVFVSDTGNVARGALAGVGISWYQAGINASKTTAAILRGKKPGDIPVLTPERFETAFNVKTQAALGITIPDKVRQGAKPVGQ